MKWALLLLLAVATPIWALDPSEMLQDPVLEARARALDSEIRCVKCQSEAIASSNAAWARDARARIRELVAQGASDQDVKDWFRERYGDFVLMRPRREGANLILWLAGPAFLVIGLAVGIAAIRRRSQATGAPALSEAEKTRIAELLDE